MLRLTDDDLIMFKYLMEEKYIYIDDVKKYLMNQKYDSDKRERLSMLKKEGYIKYKGDPGSYKNFVFPTEKAKMWLDIKKDEMRKKIKMRSNSYLKYYDVDKYSVKKDIDINSYVHDRKLTQLRFMLEEIGVDYWERETMYYNKYKKNPDAICEISNKKYAIELERSFKSEKRYETIFEKYGKIDNIKFESIIYVTTKDIVYNQLNSVINDIIVLGIKDRDWKSKYRLSKFDDFKEGKFIVYKPYLDEINDLTEIMKKYVELKEG